MALSMQGRCPFSAGGVSLTGLQGKNVTMPQACPHSVRLQKAAAQGEGPHSGEELGQIHIWMRVRVSVLLCECGQVTKPV